MPDDSVKGVLNKLFPTDDYVLTEERIISLVGKQWFKICLENEFISLYENDLWRTYRITKAGIQARDMR